MMVRVGGVGHDKAGLLLEAMTGKKLHEGEMSREVEYKEESDYPCQ
jgi:hypothetical protein